jgi:hypothetical protein
MTRRICKYQYWSYSEQVTVNCNGITQRVDKNVSCPYGKVGDKLWVRETFVPDYFDDHKPAYKADWNEIAAEYINEPKWKPSIHMPKSAARIWLEIISIKVERLQDITNTDSESEGIKTKKINGSEVYDDYNCPDSFPFIFPAQSFKSLWSKINGIESWNANPWVWVIEFKRVEPCQ